MTTNTKPIPLFDMPATDCEEQPRAAFLRTQNVIWTRKHRHNPWFPKDQFQRQLMHSFLVSFKHRHILPSCKTDTKPVVLVDLQEGQQRREYAKTWIFFESAAVAALVGLRRAMADDELSRPLELPDFKSLALCGNFAMNYRGTFDVSSELGNSLRMAITERDHAREKSEGPDQPLRFRWSKHRRQIRTAAKAYIENTHADY